MCKPKKQLFFFRPRKRKKYLFFTRRRTNSSKTSGNRRICLIQQQKAQTQTPLPIPSTNPSQTIQQHPKDLEKTPNQLLQYYAIPEDGIRPGDRLTQFYKNWTNITSHQQPLSIIKGRYQIQFTTTPIVWISSTTNLN